MLTVKAKQRRGFGSDAGMDLSMGDRNTPKLNFKRTRTTISLEQKLNIIHRAEQGERASHIARTDHLPASTIRTILSKSDSIKRFGKVTSPQNAARILRSTNTVTAEMERKLASWYKKELREGVSPSFDKLKHKALKVYRDLAKSHPNAQPFSEPNRVWLNRFKKRFNLHRNSTDSIPVQVNSPVVRPSFTPVLNALCTSTPVVNDFVLSFKKFITENDYKPQQIFSVAETVLYWKRMPSKTVSPSMEKYPEDLKDRFVLLMGGNAFGNFKLKPLSIYHLENPRALKGYPKGKLPVIWKTNPKLQLTQLDFSDWFTDYFCPAVEQFCAKNNLPNKALLVLDTAAGYPTNLDDLSNNVKVLYLSSDTTPLLQSSNFILLKMFKAHYLQRTLSQAIAATEIDASDSQSEFWDSYDIKKAICNLSDAWNDVKSCTLNSAWFKLYPDCVRKAQEMDTLSAVVENIVNLAKELGMQDIDSNNVLELLESQNDKLTESEINQLQKQRAREEFMDEDENIFPIKALTTSTLREAMDNLEAAMAMYKEYDPDSERSATVCRNIENAVTCYRELYRKKIKYVTEDSFIGLNKDTSGIGTSEGQSTSTSEQQILNQCDLIFIKEET